MLTRVDTEVEDIGTVCVCVCMGETLRGGGQSWRKTLRLGGWEVGGESPSERTVEKRPSVWCKA